MGHGHLVDILHKFAWEESRGKKPQHANQDKGNGNGNEISVVATAGYVNDLAYVKSMNAIAAAFSDGFFRLLRLRDLDWIFECDRMNTLTGLSRTAVELCHRFIRGHRV